MTKEALKLAFDEWWDTRPPRNETNPCTTDSFEYWAWEGWHAALAEHAMCEAQRLGQEIEQKPVFTYEQVKAHIQVAMMSTTPPQRKPLTDEQMKKIWYAMQNIMGWYSFQEIARAIEAAHGIKENT